MMNNSFASEFHQWARQYAALGIPVFPLRENSKEPAVAGGAHAATTDPAQIDAWWGSGQRLNVAIACVDFYVIDCDVKDGKDGLTAWRDLSGNISAAAIQQTPSGGYHYLYSGYLRNSVKRLAPGVDTRAFGGYVVAEPSIADGKEWKWCAGSNLAALTPMPDAIYEQVSQKLGDGNRIVRDADPDFVEGTEHAVAYANAYITACINRGDIPVHGNRDQHAIRCFITLYCRGVSPTQCEEIYSRFYNEGGGVEPASWDDLREKINRVWSGTIACNPAGSELVPLASEVFTDYNHAAALTAALDAIAAEPAHEAPRSKRLNRRTMAQTEEQYIEWIWEGWLARGFFHVLGGKKATGKSTLCFTILAAITRGGPFPDGRRCPPGDVLIWSSEDSWEKTIVPRLRAAGADPDRVHWIDSVDEVAIGRRKFRPATDVPDLMAEAETIPELAAIMIDPMVAVMGRADSHKNAEAREAMQPLVELAEARNLALIGVTHFTKGTDGADPIERLSGSLAVGALPRIIWGATKEDEQHRRFVRVGSNIGPSGGGFDYKLEQVNAVGKPGAQRIAWGDALEGEAKELIGTGKPDTRYDAAEAWLLTKLQAAGAFGEVVADLKSEAAATWGSSVWKTVEKVRTAHRGAITTDKRQSGKEWCWFWHKETAIEPEPVW